MSLKADILNPPNPSKLWGFQPPSSREQLTGDTVGGKMPCAWNTPILGAAGPFCDNVDPLCQHSEPAKVDWLYLLRVTHSGMQFAIASLPWYCGCHSIPAPGTQCTWDLDMPFWVGNEFCTYHIVGRLSLKADWFLNIYCQVVLWRCLPNPVWVLLRQWVPGKSGFLLSWVLLAAVAVGGPH